MFCLFVIVIYITIIYSNYKFNKDKRVVDVKTIALPTHYSDYFKHNQLINKYNVMFGNTGNELNLINSNIEMSNKIEKKPFIPQQNFISL